MVTAITIAASDCSSGAGVQADLAVMRDLGVYGFCAVTNVTVQNSQGVHKVCKVPPKIVAQQIDAVTRDFGVAACKVGMLYSPTVLDLVSERIHRREIPNVVLDPVMNAKHGEVLLMPPAIKRMKRWLIPKVTVITPNADEAQRLTGIEVHDIAGAKDAAKALTDMGAKYALVKGGHISGEPVDVLYDRQNFTEFPGKRQDKNMHGTGCVLSAAIAARLALGDSMVDAVHFAKEYVAKAIEHSVRMGKGKLDYFFQI
ncbi:MAG: bifunctional hydroxymethylpyrimidine kinase/phosphomethylpyrimidine kinase [Armatimonadota bacterium]|nr:bifunctional hydroxymethylpyrimidine kinase/phosphomethylpyrimidine kinase [bacterium]